MPLSFNPRIAIPVPTSADLPYNQRSWKQYAAAVLDAGGEPVELALHTEPRTLRALLTSCSGACLPGSPADIEPVRYGAERDAATAPADPTREIVDTAVLDWASAESTPVLGICFGLQSINVWRGGTLVQDLHVLPVNHSAGASVAVAHSALVPAVSALGALLDVAEAPLTDSLLRLPVNSSHHQAIGTPGDGLRVVARCPEDGVIEALEQASDLGPGPRPSWLLGVQWHPERSTAASAASRALFRELVRQAGGRTQ